jgi:excisionase family DNA binding protein
MKDFYTVTEAAKHLKLTRQVVLYAIKIGKLPVVRSGRQWMVHKVNISRGYFINDFGKEIRRELSDHFNGYNWNNEKRYEIYDQFANFQKMPEYIEKLFTEANSILNTMVFINDL